MDSLHRYTDPDGLWAIPLFQISLATFKVVILPALEYAVGTIIAGCLGWKVGEWTNKDDQTEQTQAENPAKDGAQSQNNPKGQKSTLNNNKKHDPNQEALSELAKEGERKGVTQAEADTLLNWADEYDFPGRDDRGEDHWIGGEHIHLGGKHIPVL